MSEIADPVREVARVRPEVPAVIGPHGTWSYAALDRRVTALAVQLRAEGMQRGDRLAIYRPPDAEYLALLLAAFRTGVVVAPLNTRQPAATVPLLLKRIGCHTIVAEPDGAWNDLRTLGFAAPDPSDDDADADASWHLDAPGTLVFTSGSTGTPKAALHTLENHVWSARGSVDFFDLKSGDRWLLDLPLYHVGGLAVLFRCVLAGATIVLPRPEESTAATVERYRVTHLSLVATQLLRALRDSAEALESTKAILLGGSAIPPGLVAEAHARGLPISTSYGMTEMASTVTATPPNAGLDALGTAGVVLPHREVALADDGEILVRGATLFAGYAEGDTTERPGCDGWFPTGDLGAWREIGGARMLRVVGRKDHLFISGGENVQPEEIEAALGRIDGVRRAVVVPAPDAEFGQRPVAFVEAETWAPHAWRDELGASLARFKIPVSFYPWPAEADGEMKVSRSSLRARAAVRADAR